MAFLFTLLTNFLVFLFFAGIAGSIIVVIITFIEDGALLVESDPPPIASPLSGESQLPQITTARVAD
jgi:hypothetical protein